LASAIAGLLPATALAAATPQIFQIVLGDAFAAGFSGLALARCGRR
jgi:hypothetical protein